MKCDKCDSEATVHEVRIEAGKRREKHLCEHCAKADGVAPQITSSSIATLLTGQFITSQGQAAPGASAAAPAAPASPPCPSCGLTYSQFRQTGLLGCPKCYEAFESQLTPLLARAHEGGTHHKGKSPRRIPAAPTTGTAVGSPARPVAAGPKQSPTTVSAAPPPPDAARIADLKKRLAEAVAAEHYEKAAKLRDELAGLEGKPARPVAKRRAAPAPPKESSP